MKIIRKNKDSILAILETFVHDPLLGWKAMNGSDLVGEPMVAIREDDGASGTDPI